MPKTVTKTQQDAGQKLLEAAQQDAAQEAAEAAQDAQQDAAQEVTAEALEAAQEAAQQEDAQRTEAAALDAVVKAIRAFIPPTVKSFFRRVKEAVNGTGRANAVAEAAAGTLAPYLASYAVEYPDTARIALTVSVKLDAAPKDARLRRQYVYREVMRAMTGNGSSRDSFVYLSAAVTEVVRKQDADGIAQPHDHVTYRAGIGAKEAVKRTNKYLKTLPAALERSKIAQDEAAQRKAQADAALLESFKSSEDFQKLLEAEIQKRMAAQPHAREAQPQQDAQPQA